MMKYCSHFYSYLYLDYYDGRVCLCPWMDPNVSVIGNLVHDKIEVAYNSDHAKYLRSTMDDQTFKHCRREACPRLQNDDLEDISSEEYQHRMKTSYYPTEINMAHDFICNQYCETCRKAIFVPPPEYDKKMRAIHEKIALYLDTAERVTASGHGDPFASKYMMEILENLRPTRQDSSFLIETNGVLLDEEHWERIKHLREFHLEVVVTINSFDEFTYKHISRGGNFAKAMHNLDFMSRLRTSKDIARLTNTLVIQDRNFREIPSFIKRSFDSYAFDSVMLRPVYQWGTMDEDVYWLKDVLNPLHPYHQEYLEILQNPALKDSRVYNFGGDTVHKANPYPSALSANCIFPYDVVKRNSKIIIYGAGQVGREFIHQLNSNNFCEVILWIDKSFDNECVMPPDRLLIISRDDYDYVVLATLNRFFTEEMKCNLTDMGVPEERIISCICEAVQDELNECVRM